MKGQFLQQVLQLKPGEQRFVRWGFFLSLLTGLPRLFSMTLGNALFLSNFSAAYLPLVYLGSAILNPVVGIVYLFLEKRLSFRALQNWSLTLLWVVSGIFTFLLYSQQVSLGLVGLAILIWLDIEWTVTNLLHWGTLNRISTLDQSKRLYGIIGTGEILMLVLGGLITPIMVRYFGISSLILFSLGGFLLMIPVLNGLLFRYTPQEDQVAPIPKKTIPKGQGLFKTFPVLLILFFGFFQYGIEFFGDTLFYMGAEQEFLTAEALAGFFARYFPLLGALTLAFKLFLSGRILPKFGLGISLLITPLGLLIGGLLVMLLDGLAVVIGLRLFQAVFFSGLVYPAFYSLLQPLEPRQRSRVQTLSELVYGPLIGILLGGGLFFLTGFGQVGIKGLGLLVALSALVWLVLSRSTFHHYTEALDQAMDQGVFSTRPELLDYQAQKRLAESLLEDQSNLARLKLEFLQSAEYPDLRKLYTSLLSHKDLELRIRGYQGIGKAFSTWNTPEITKLLKQETQVLGQQVLSGQIACYTKHFQDLPTESVTGSPRTLLDLNQLIVATLESPHFDQPAKLFKLLATSKETQDLLLFFPSEDLASILLRIYKPSPILGSSSYDHQFLQDFSEGEIRQIFRWAEQWLSTQHQISTPGLLEVLDSYTADDLRDGNLQRLFVRKLLGVLGRVPSKLHFKSLVTSATKLEAGLRGTALSMAFRLAIRNEGLVDPNLSQTISQILWSIRREHYLLVSFVEHVLSFSPSHKLDQASTQTQEHRQQVLEAAEESRQGFTRQIFQALGLIYSSSMLDSLDRTFRLGSADKRALALERLETLISSEHWAILGPFFFQVMLPLGSVSNSLDRKDSKDQDTDLEEVIDYGALGISGSWLGHLLAPDLDHEPQVEAARALKNLGLFQQVPLSQLWHLAKDGTIHQYKKKTKVITQGDVGTSMFIPLLGEPEIVKHRKERFTLPLGTVIGEFAALDNEPRSASVYAPKGARWFELSQEVLQDAIQVNPELALAILGVVSEKAENHQRALQKEGLLGNPPVELLLGPLDYSNSRITTRDFQSQALGFFDRAQLLQQLPLLHKLRSEELLSLSSATEQEFYTSGATLWSSDSPDLCICLSGKVSFVQPERPIQDSAPVFICPEELFVLGQSKVFQRHNNSFSLIGKSEVQLLRVPTVAIESLIWVDPEALFRLATPLLQFIRNGA